MSSEAAISVHGLSKAYFLYPEPRDRLRQAFRPRLAQALQSLGIHLPERRYFTEHWALKDLSFEVERGETVAIIGRNGAGKSTLLQLICGTLAPTAGEVCVRGRVAALLELGSGFNPEYTGRENVLLNASVLGLSNEETLARMDRILAFADIGSFVDHPVKTYSSGMAMRLAFAVVAHVDAEVLIVDEALSVGDAYFQQKCFRWLRDFQSRGTLLFCGHDLGAVMSLCQRAIWIDRGGLRMAGTAKSVAEAYASSMHAEAMGLPAPASLDATVTALSEVTLEGVAADDAAAAPEIDGPVLRLDSNAFGSGLARVTEVRLETTDGSPLSLVEGGQAVVLRVRAVSEAPISDVIVGFHLKDRLGQVLFTQNSFRHLVGKPFALAANEAVDAEFRFRMPLLVPGDYAFGAAIASGTQERPIMHHFVHEALIVHVSTLNHLGGIVAVPLESVRLLAGPV
jgi:lipopolysaccharide transport system ATP-binding protein